MAGRSSLKSLPPSVLDAVHDAIGRGQTIDDICELLRDLGTERSRSAVGRYAKDFAELAKQQRRLQTISQAFGKEFGSSDDHQVRMMNQLMTSVMMRAILPIASADEDAPAEDDEDGGKPDILALSRLAKAVKDVTSSSKIDIERESKIREEEARRTRERAAAEATEAGRAAGASEATLAAIRTRILGFAA
ncbi:phage protein Gp27 family protein [Sphingomonas sp. SORGH_AS_0879]|uniref:phage protein Gp27 family protein n=1 Tax=Sphingomonas sp. SORGH_AS_0879 TaxID=3041790 RepID=UPI0027824E8B|nr:phage protein Gp27 family protein [Sphingomonas sp. SORGH_AS_0879]MDQ1229304.1 hypothetical protein [Sphingomonas sp. SORGH_AS_0879]